MFIDFQTVVDKIMILDGVSIAMPGYDDYDEIRITCFTEDEQEYIANYIKHSKSGGFIYGGESNCVFAYDAETALAECLRRAFETDEYFEDTDIEIFEMHDLDRVSRAELIYGSEAWDAYDRGYEIR